MLGGEPTPHVLRARRLNLEPIDMVAAKLIDEIYRAEREQENRCPYVTVLQDKTPSRITGTYRTPHLKGKDDVLEKIVVQQENNALDVLFAGQPLIRVEYFGIPLADDPPFPTCARFSIDLQPRKRISFAETYFEIVDCAQEQRFDMKACLLAYGRLKYEEVVYELGVHILAPEQIARIKGQRQPHLLLGLYGEANVRVEEDQKYKNEPLEEGSRIVIPGNTQHVIGTGEKGSAWLTLAEFVDPKSVHAPLQRRAV